MMDHDAEIERAMAQVGEDLKTLRQRIAVVEVPDEQTWFRNLLVGILNCAATDYRTVEIGVEKLVALAAWGCRNLLELKVLTEYVLASEENAVAIQGDLVLDAKEFYEAVSKSHIAAHRQYLDALSELANQEQGVLKAKLQEALERDAKLGPQMELIDAPAPWKEDDWSEGEPRSTDRVKAPRPKRTKASSSRAKSELRRPPFGQKAVLDAQFPLDASFPNNGNIGATVRLLPTDNEPSLSFGNVYR